MPSHLPGTCFVSLISSHLIFWRGCAWGNEPSKTNKHLALCLHHAPASQPLWQETYRHTDRQTEDIHTYIHIVQYNSMQCSIRHTDDCLNGRPHACTYACDGTPSLTSHHPGSTVPFQTSKRKSEMGGQTDRETDKPDGQPQDAKHSTTSPTTPGHEHPRHTLFHLETPAESIYPTQSHRPKGTLQFPSQTKGDLVFSDYLPSRLGNKETLRPE